MKKGIVLLTILILSFQFMFQPIEKAQAVGVDTVLKLVGGKAVVRALAEKAGVAMSKKQLDNVTGFIEQETFKGNQKAIDFVNSANNLSSSGASSRSGFKKYLLDSLDWLTGLDLVFAAIGAFKQGYESGTPVDIYGKCMTAKPWAGSSTYTYFIVYNNNTEGVEMKTAGYYDGNGVLKNTGGWRYYKFNGTSWSYISSGTFQDVTIGNANTVINGGNVDSSCRFVPIASDVPNIINVAPSIINNFDNDTYNQNTTYNIEIEMPDIVNYDDTTPWNGIDPNLEDEVNGGSGDDTGGEYVDSPDDPTDDPPSGSKWWEWLLGPLKSIGDFFKNILEWLISILVPSGDKVTESFDGITDSFKAKLPIADQLGTFFGEIEEIQTNGTPTAPTFDITMPTEWGGGTFPMIDFSYFAQWRDWILNFIRFTAWFTFLKRLYNRIPKMIY